MIISDLLPKKANKLENPASTTSNVYCGVIEWHTISIGNRLAICIHYTMTVPYMHACVHAFLNEMVKKYQDGHYFHRFDPACPQTWSCAFPL